MTEKSSSPTNDMTNYAQPYRNLPAEIRLQIWSLVIPQRVTVTRGLEPDYVAAADPHGHLGLMPSLQIQLLRLNREVYHEVLPMLKNVEVHLDCYIDYDYLWCKLTASMQSPLLNTIYYPWHCPGGNCVEYFLPKLLVEGLPGSLRCLNVNIARSHRPHMIAVVSPPNGTNRLRGCLIPGPWFLASICGACLQKAIVSEQIDINIEEIDHQYLNVWSPETLYKYMKAELREALPPDVDLVAALDLFVQEHAGITKRSDIQIATDLTEIDKSGKYRGTVKFTRVLK